jgi:hypothetical protein
LTLPCLPCTPSIDYVDSSTDCANFSANYANKSNDYANTFDDKVKFSANSIDTFDRSSSNFYTPNPSLL